MAITNYEDIISNLSYTEKDFQTIYPSLLDLVAKETKKWDPSMSNESDPGVLLLKLNALIADKCNYNIDKNVLECFPVSVTQDKNAWQIFEQLGYYMHWYQSAETVVSLKWIGDSATDSDGNTVAYTIPKFTMVCDSDSKYVYTLVDEKTLSTDGTTQAIYAKQGIAVNYAINSNTLITTSNLDSNNRIYFTDTDVAENGIYITNYGATNYTDWVKKDNLLVEEVSADNHFYKFGVSQDLSTCYLEFPENAEELFQEGINITYLKTSGADGNIAPYELDSFYSDVTVSDPTSSDDTATVSLTTDDVSINNYIYAVGGDDIETINEAYLNYKKIVGTFDTLVTLRDYMNAARMSEYVSNAIVSDRTTDVQSSYDIVTKSGTTNALINEVEIGNDTNDIQGYLYQNEFYLDSSYNQRLTPDVSKNYQDIPTGNWYRVIYLNKVYTYTRSDKVDSPALDAFNLKLYILSASSLMKTATNYNTTFTMDISDTINNIVKSEINEYQCIQHNFAGLLLNKICFIKNKYPIDCKVIPQYVLTDAQKTDVATNIRQALYKNLNSSQIEFGQEIVYEDVYNIILNADSRIKAIALSPLTYSTYVVYLTKNTLGTVVVKELDITDLDTTLDADGNTIITSDSLINEFRNEIYAKSVLAGKTQFFIKDTEFEFGINQKYQLLERNIGRMDTNLNVTFNSSNAWQYLVRENEAIQLYAPNLIEMANYSSNIKMEYHLNSTVPSSASYLLGTDEYIIFYWTDENSEDSGYAYAVYGKGTIIQPSFTLDASVASSSKLVGNTLLSKCTEAKVATQTYLYCTGYTINEDTATALTAAVKKMTDASNILSGSRVIQILAKNSLILDDTSYYCYWILNEDTQGKYVLFNENSGNSRILKSGEYFIYTNSTTADMTILGEGTQITRSGFTGTFEVEAIEYSEIVDSGLLAISDYWKQLPKDYVLNITEMQYTALGDGAIASIYPSTPKATTLQTFTEGTKYEYYIPGGIATEDISYTLKSGEYIIYYELSGTDPVDYIYQICGEGSIVKPGFKLEHSESSAQSLIGKDLIALLKNQTNYTIYNKTTVTEAITSATYEVKVDDASSINDDSYIYIDDTCYQVASVENNTLTLYTQISSAALGATVYFGNINQSENYYSYATGHTEDVSEELSTAVHNITDENKILSSAQTISFQAFNAPTIKEIKLSSSSETILNYCSIRYKEDVTSTEWVDIPVILLSDIDFTWRALSLLRLNITTGTYQILKSGQSITYFKYDDDDDRCWVVTKDKKDSYITTVNTEFDSSGYTRRYEYYTESELPTDVSYTLKSGEYFAIYYQTTEETTNYKYYIFGNGAVITTTYALEDPVASVDDLLCSQYQLIDDDFTYTQFLFDATEPSSTSTVAAELNAKIALLSALSSSDKLTAVATDSREWESVRPKDIIPGVAPFDADNTYLLTSRLINDIGPSISTLEKDTNDVWQPLSIYAYILGSMSDDVKILEDGTTNVVFQSDPHIEQEKSITFKLPSGDYIIPMYHNTTLDANNNYYITDLNLILSPYNLNLTDDLFNIECTFEDTLSLLSDKEYTITFEVKNVESYEYTDTSGTVTKYVTVTNGYADGIVFSEGTLKYNNYRTSKSDTGSDIVVYTNSSGWVDTKYKIVKFTDDTSSSDLSSLNLWLNANSNAIAKELTSMGNNKTSNLYESGNYYLRIDDLADDNDTSGFFVTLKVHLKYAKQYTSLTVPGISVIIPPIFKYSATTSLNSDADLNAQLYIDIYEKIKELDYEGLFDYTYVVDEDEAIEDPLLPISYLDSDHVMNSYTICQMNTGSDTNIYIANSTRG